MNTIFTDEYRRYGIFDDTTTFGTEPNIQEMKKLLKEKFNVRIKPENLENKYTHQDYKFEITDRNRQQDEISDFLRQYHYWISNPSEYDWTKHRVGLMSPIRANSLLEKDNIKDLYHIVPNFKLKQIEKYGLAPRGKDTTFKIYKDRIFLVSTDTKDLKRLLKELSKKYNLDEKEFTIFKTLYNKKYNYLLQDSASFFTFQMIAVVIAQNIPYNELEIIKL